MPDKEQVMKYYPDARCTIEFTKRCDKMFVIRVEDRILTRSFDSEEKAWKWALLLVNQIIMELLKQ